MKNITHTLGICDVKIGAKRIDDIIKDLKAIKKKGKKTFRVKVNMDFITKETGDWTEEVNNKGRTTYTFEVE